MKNKREFSIARIFLLVGIIATFLLINRFLYKERQTFLSDQTTINSHSIAANLKTYTNSRFGFSIKYPGNWPTGRESDNGDGLALYSDKPNNEVLVYGTNMPSSFSAQHDSVEREEIILDDERKAALLKFKDEKGKINYIMFFNRDNNQEGKQYVFYATVTEHFFKENEQILQAVAKSLTLSSVPGNSQSFTDLDLAIKRVEKEGYTVIDGSKTWYSSSESLNILIGACAGAEGYCKQAFFFYNGEYLGTDTSEPSSQISIVWRDDTTIALNYVLYHKDDPMCCPTAGAVTVRFQWNGSKLVALDPIPPLGLSADVHR